MGSEIVKHHNSIDLVSSLVAKKLEEFSAEFISSLVAYVDEPWAKQLGRYEETAAMSTTYPISISAAGYEPFEGDRKFRNLFDDEIKIELTEWSDGVLVPYIKISRLDFAGFSKEPAAIAHASKTLINKCVVARLIENGLAWDKQPFFSVNHKVNHLDTESGVFSNDFGGPGTEPSADNLRKAMDRFAAIRKPNGESLGLAMTHIMCHRSRASVWRDILKSDNVIRAIYNASGQMAFGPVGNLDKDAVTCVTCDELVDENTWYALALNKKDMVPWIVQDQGAPEQIQITKDSHTYLQKSEVGFWYRMVAGSVLAHFHCLHRWAGLPPSSGSAVLSGGFPILDE
jgi:hypothetical protein